MRKTCKIKKQRVQLRVSKNTCAMSLNRIQHLLCKWKGWDEGDLYYFSRATKSTQTSEESVNSTCLKHWETIWRHKVMPFRSGALQTWLFCPIIQVVKGFGYTSFFLCCTTSSIPDRWVLVKFAQSRCLVCRQLFYPWLWCLLRFIWILSPFQRITKTKPPMWRLSYATALKTYRTTHWMKIKEAQGKPGMGCL